MKTIALLTDFGADSFYVGVMKAVLAAAAPGVAVVDVTHGIAPQALLQASFVLDRVFDWFAPGTIFVAVVDPGVGSDRRALVVEAGGRSVVAPDNGLAWECVARRAPRAVAVDEATLAPYRAHAPIGSTFHGRDVFAPAAAALARGVEARALGTAADRIEAPAGLPAVVRGDGVVRGAGRYVDTFGNILSNIAAEDLAAVFGERFRDSARVSVAGRDVGALRDFYAGGAPGAPMAVLNSWGLVEVSINGGRAADAFDARPVESLAFEVKASP